MGQVEITIRRAGEKDVPTIVELNYALFQEDAERRDPLAYAANERAVAFYRKLGFSPAAGLEDGL